MQKSTGELFGVDEARELAKSLGVNFEDEFVEVNSQDMTKKQMEEKRVSLKDNRSKLGKQLVASRILNKRKKKARKSSKMSKKKNRRK